MTMLHFNVNGTDTLKPSRVNTPANYASYTIDGKGPLTSTNGESGQGFVRTKYADKKVQSVPDIQLSYHAMTPMSFEEDSFWNSVLGFRPEVWKKYFQPYYGTESTSIFINLLHPKSRGSVTLRTDNPLDDPVVQPNYFKETDDVHTIVEGVKIGIQLGMSPPFAKHAPTMNPMHLPGCETFELWSDAYIQCYAKYYTVKGKRSLLFTTII